MVAATTRTPVGFGTDLEACAGGATVIVASAATKAAALHPEWCPIIPVDIGTGAETFTGHEGTQLMAARAASAGEGTRHA